MATDLAPLVEIAKTFLALPYVDEFRTAIMEMQLAA